MPASWTLPAVVLVACLVPAAVPAQDDPLAGPRAEFIAAYAAARRAAEPAQPDSEALRRYPLYAYLEAARLLGLLADEDAAVRLAADRPVAEFLARQGREPAANGLRRAWLTSLARRKAWGAFLAQYVEADAKDPVLRCHALAARIAPGRTDGLAQQAADAWLTPRSAPDECDAVFDWLRAQGRLDDALVEQRARLALASGETRLARWLARALPDSRAGPLLAWIRLIEHPRDAIDALIDRPATPVEEAALLDGWTRLARRDPDAAHERLDALVAARGLDAGQASRFARTLALGLAWSRRPEALARFRQVAAADYDEPALEWRVRAALWKGDWAAASAALDAMPEPLRDETRWRYWAARSAEALGRHEQARELYATVVPTDNWYAVLAAARRGTPFAPRSEPLVFDDARIAELGTQPAFVRARELLRVGLAHLAPAEWATGHAALPAADQRQAIGLAARWGWHFQAIASAARQGVFNDYSLLYPRPYDSEVTAASERSDLPPTLIHAVIRQESLYQPYAVSSANAVGLMQLLPATARRTAVEMGRPRPSAAALTQPAVNVPLGAGYLRGLIERFDGQVVPALAGYNAGPTAARRWLPDSPMDADRWVENIPFNETRVYVQRVMWHGVVFEWLAEGKPQDATSWLGTVR